MRANPWIYLVATSAAALLTAVPAAVLADCNGPVCGEVEKGLDSLGIALLGVLLTVFVTVMTVGGRLVRSGLRPTD